MSAAGLGKDTFSIKKKKQIVIVFVLTIEAFLKLFIIWKKNLESPTSISHPGYSIVSDKNMLLNFSFQLNKLGRGNG